MKNFFKRISKYSFWTSFAGAMILLLNAFGRAFGFEIENKIVEDCILAFAGILVVLGVVSKPKAQDEKADDKPDDKHLEE